MKNLKTISLSKIIIICFLFVIIYTYLNVTNTKHKSKYQLTETNVIGYIINKKIDGNKLTIQLRGKEQILVTYYIENVEELNKFIDYQLGDYINVTGEIIEPSPNTNFNLFNYKNYLKSIKINYLMKASKIEIIQENRNYLFKIKNNIISKINTYEKSSYFKVFILGDTSTIDQDIYDSYKNNGITHLFAISGMHISLLSSILLNILNRITKKETGNYVVVSIFLIFYAFLVNFSPSVLRATLMFILMFIKKQLHIKINNSYILILVLSLMLLYNPFYVYNVGFQFSFIISYFLIIFSHNINNQANYFMKVFETSKIAFLSSIPIMITNFFKINILAPIINTIVVPIISIVIFPLSLLVFIIKPLELILNPLITVFEQLSLYLESYKINIVLCNISFPFIIGYYVIIYLSLKNSKNLIILFIVVIFHTNINIICKEVSLHMIDVNQGDSILLRIDNRAVLIDTGGLMTYGSEEWQKKKEYSIAKNTIIPYINSLGIKKIDYLILTHGDYDHVGEAINLIENIRIGTIYLNNGNTNYLEEQIKKKAKQFNIPIDEITQKNIIINNVKLSIINYLNSESENEDSLIIHTKINNKNILLMGDAGKVTEKHLISEYNLPKMDILKVGHHGSKNSSSLEFLEKIAPSYSLISSGKNNRFNHPHQITLDNLDSIKSIYYNTSVNGSIKILFKNGITIDTCLQ